MTTETTKTPQEIRIAQAKARLEAAKLRILACSQDQYSAGATRTGNDTGRAECHEKAAQYAAHAAETRAQADLIEAEAGI